MPSSSSSSFPCAACKSLRRKCLPDCIFAPHFPQEELQKFANVHKIFGASNIAKLLNEIVPHLRKDAVNSLAYEAEARLKDPVFGCVGAISALQRQILHLQDELDAANFNLIRYAWDEVQSGHVPLPPHVAIARQRSLEFGTRIGTQGHSFYHASGFPIPYSLPWSN